MTGLFWNVLLATCWVFLTGSFESLNYAFGFFIGYLVIAMIHARVPALKGYPHRLPRFIGFICFFIWELLLSNIKVAIDIVTPLRNTKPGVLRFPLSTRNDLEITLISNFISLTPGTLVLDASEDKSALFIHSMFLDDEEQALADWHELEDKLLRVIR